MEPILIPTVTVKGESDYAEHLHSPSIRNPLIRARERTIIDCSTYGLVRNPQSNAYEHYAWYCKFAAEQQHDPTLIFIAPDADWLGKKIAIIIGNQWLDNVTMAKQLVIPDTYLFERVSHEFIVGHALKPGQTGPVHPQWTHSFSKFYKQLSGKTQRWTYDAQGVTD